MGRGFDWSWLSPVMFKGDGSEAQSSLADLGRWMAGGKGFFSPLHCDPGICWKLDRDAMLILRCWGLKDVLKQQRM